MIWIVSYPRSGNTFFRNVLYFVYGIESSVYYKFENGQLKDPQYNNSRFCKTHHLPFDVPLDRESKVVYLVRDGRDVMVSSAHHKADIVEPGSDYYNNLHGVSATKGLNGFGGWSDNVELWTEKADIVIKFEALINNPLGELEKLRVFTELPSPNIQEIPTFESQKSGIFKYSGEDYLNFFRRGKIGSYRDEMPMEIQNKFWSLHGETMVKMGYARH